MTEIGFIWARAAKSSLGNAIPVSEKSFLINQESVFKHDLDVLHLAWLVRKIGVFVQIRISVRDRACRYDH